METLRATVQLLTAADGGRGGSYRPHITVNGGPYLGVVIRSENVATLQPGEEAPVLLDLLYDIDYRALFSGAKFDIHEGPHKIGTGQISQRY